ncbi:MAG: hypothetical protein RI932_940 [Pseudomonadota bacterium]|jgi:carbamoyl-phosphate synthase small subunit
MRASLLMDDGTFVVGEALGAACETVAEVVFNTAMSGYEEVLTDPSYAGQFVLFTTSHIGNTGITHLDSESRTLCAEGFLCRDFSFEHDNWRARESLEEFLKNSGKCAVTGIDTRFLAQRLRQRGAMKAILSTSDFDPASLQRKLEKSADISQRDLVSQTRSFSWQKGRNQNGSSSPAKSFRVVAVDCGMKRGIFDDLEALGLELFVVGPDARVADIEAIRPDGLFFGNGPGCPRQLAEHSGVLELIREFSPRLPTFGICLGHQLIALAFGGETAKLEFGHHAVNHPVVSLVALPGLQAGTVMITSQNHNYYVIESSITDSFEVTHRHMNDSTVAGMRHRLHPIFSVQFHPECNPGPEDAKPLFQVFLHMLKEHHHAHAY